MAIKYRDKYGIDMPTLKLARIMYNENNLMFTSLEGARTTLRSIEGKSSSTSEKGQIANKKYMGIPERPRNPYNLPKSEETEYLPYKVAGKKIGLLCDIHAPYHSIDAITAALNYFKKEKVDTVVLNGDLFDFHGLSKYLKDPRKKSFAYELDCGANIINIIRKKLNCQVIYKLGNHDERYQHYLWMKAGEIADVEDFKLKNLLIKRGCDIEIVEDKRILHAGSLNIVHGHEFPSGISSPVNIARGFYLRGKTSVIGGHHHRTSEHTAKDMNDDIVTAWSVGCLSELHPAYMPINEWNHGCAMIEVSGNEFMTHNKRIYNGKLL